MGLNVILDVFLRTGIPFSGCLLDKIIGPHKVFLALKGVLFLHFHQHRRVKQLLHSVKIFVLRD